MHTFFLSNYEFKFLTRSASVCGFHTSKEKKVILHCLTLRRVMSKKRCTKMFIPSWRMAKSRPTVLFNKNTPLSRCTLKILLRLTDTVSSPARHSINNDDVLSLHSTAIVHLHMYM